MFRGDEGVGESGDLAKDRWEKDNGRRGKKMTEERGKKEDDGGRKKEIVGEENRYEGQMSGPGEFSGISREESPEQRRFRGNFR